MTTTLHVAKVHSASGPDNNNCNLGALCLSDGTLLCGLGENFDDPTTRWYRSTNNGLTWTAVGTSGGGIHNNSNFAAHSPPNIAFAPSTNLEFVNASIRRSTDKGSTWSQVFNAESPQDPPFRTTVCAQIATYGIHNAIAIGQFQPTPGGAWVHTLVSADDGASWSDGVSIFRENNGTWGQCIANVGAGHFVAIAQSTPTDPNKTAVWHSTDYGASWSIVGNLPYPSGVTILEPTAITIINPTVWLISGIHNPSSTGAIPALYRTTDAGVTWTVIPSSAIWSWPSDGSPVPIWEVKRLTRDAVIFGTRCPSGGTTPPWRVSIDAGENWDEVTVIDDSGITTDSQAVGAIVTAFDGHLILPVFANPGGTSSLEIWRGTWTC